MTELDCSDVTQQCRYLHCSNTTCQYRYGCRQKTETEAKIIIHESIEPLSCASFGHIGKFTRKARKNIYVSPRLLFPRDYSEHIGKDVRIFKAKLSVEGLDFLKDKDALILVFPGPYEEPACHMILPEESE